MAERKRRGRRWPIWATLAVAALIFGAYAHLTNPARLRIRVLEALRTLPVGNVEIGAVTFSARGRLELSDLVLSPLHVVPFYRPPAGARTPPFLRIGSAQVACGLGDLLLGRFRPERIELRRVALAIVCSPEHLADEAAAEHADADARLLWRRLSAADVGLPPVSVRQADVQVFVVERGRPQLVQRQLLSADGRATADGYVLRLDHRPVRDEPLAELRWDQPAGVGALRLDWVDLETVARFLPAPAAESVTRVGLAGRALLDHLVIHLPPTRSDGDPSHAWLGPVVVRFADLRCALPLEDYEGAPAAVARAGPLGGCFLQLTGGQGTFAYHPAERGSPGQCEVSVQGQLRGAATSLHARTQAALLEHVWAAQLAPAGTGKRPSVSVDDIVQAEFRVDGIELPTAESHPAFVRSQRLSGPVVAALRDYRPRGKVNLRLRIQPSEAGAGAAPPRSGAARFEGEIEALGASCRYRHFPYDFEDVHGILRLSQGRLLLEQLTGRHGTGVVRGDGVVNSTRSWAGFDLRFHGQDVPLDAELYAALPERYRLVWRQSSPLGLCDALVAVRRPDGTAEAGPADADVQVQADLLHGSLAIGDGRRLDHVDGRLTVSNGLVRIENLHGYDGDTGVRLDGEVRLVDGDTHTDLRVQVHDLEIDHTAVLAASGTDDAMEVRFEGQADVWGRVHGAARDGGQQRSLTVRIKAGELFGRAPDRRWSVRDGLVRVQNGAHDILSFTCEQAGSRLELAATLPDVHEPGAPLSLRAHAQTTAIEALYPQFLPTRWSELIDQLGLAGAADLAVALQAGETIGGAGQQVADITIRAAQMQPQLLPLDLRNVAGELTLAPGSFRVARATADLGARGRVLVTQHEAGTWRAGEIDATFAVAANDVVLDSELIRALPGAAPQLLERLGLAGEIDAALSSVSVSGGAPRTWRLEGRLPLREVALALGLDVTIGTGELSGSCTITPQGEVEAELGFRIEQGRLAGRTIEDWEGLIRHAPGARSVQLENLRGRLGDGAVQGALYVDPDTADYELSATLWDISTDKLLPRRGEPHAPPDRPRPGRISGEVWLRGTGGDASTRRGGGELLVRGATFLQTPVLASVFRLRPPPASDVLNQARVRFRWEGSVIRLERIAIDGSDLRLVGNGTWNMRDDTVRMTLWAARPELWPRLEALDRVLELAGQELVQYRVEGTLPEPKVTAQPLHRITSVLRALLRER